MDILLFGVYLALVVLGWIMVSASLNTENLFAEMFNIKYVIGKQTVFLGISIVTVMLIQFFDLKFWQTIAYPAYGFSLFLLLLVLVVGTEMKGARSWFHLFGFSFQPSELCKFTTALAMASYLSAYDSDLRRWKNIGVAFSLLLAPVILILLQPDAGSAIIFASFLVVMYRNGLSSNLYIVGFMMIALFVLGLIFNPAIVMLGLILLGMLMLALNFDDRLVPLGVLGMLSIGAIFAVQNGYTYEIMGFAVVGLLIGLFFQYKELKTNLFQPLAVMLLFGGAFTYLANYTVNNILKSHQQDRINVWLRPDLCDPQGSLYNVLQSKMTIGSGGLQGKGLMQGTMTKLNYVPEQSTDFIFCTIGEEQGFVGAFGILIIFLLFLYRIIVIAERQKVPFSRNYAYCLLGLIFLHVFINIGMTMGIVPIIGIPLPFISAGGTSLLIFSSMVGVLLKLDSDRK